MRGQYLYFKHHILHVIYRIDNSVLKNVVFLCDSNINGFKHLEQLGMQFYLKYSLSTKSNLNYYKMVQSIDIFSANVANCGLSLYNRQWCGPERNLT